MSHQATPRLATPHPPRSFLQVRTTMRPFVPFSRSAEAHESLMKDLQRETHLRQERCPYTARLVSHLVSPLISLPLLVSLPLSGLSSAVAFPFLDLNALH